MKIDTSFRRAWRWTVLVIVLLSSLLALLLVTGRAPQKHIANTTDARSALVRASPQSAVSHVNTGVQRAPAPAPSPAVMDVLCGVSGPELARTGNETIEEHVARLTQTAISHWQSALAASEDPRRQAIGLALANAQPKPTFGSERSKDTPVNNKLVLLAIETGDPAIYSLAIGQCQGDLYDMAPGPCQGLSWEHWADIDPGNAVPWLWIAAKAERAGDQQRVEEALATAATAARIDAYGTALSATALGALPGDISPLEKAVAGADVISILRIGTPIETASLCSETAIQQPLRKKQCSAIARVLAAQGSTLIELSLASFLADRLAFPQDMRSALKTESKNARTALTRSYPWGDSAGGATFGCDTVLGYDSFIDALQAAGGNGRAAARALVAAGRPADGH